MPRTASSQPYGDWPSGLRAGSPPSPPPPLIRPSRRLLRRSRRFWVPVPNLERSGRRRLIERGGLHDGAEILQKLRVPPREKSLDLRSEEHTSELQSLMRNSY